LREKRFTDLASPFPGASHRYHLADEHIRALDADADHAGQQQHHRVCWLVRRSPEPLQPSPLDCLDLLLNDRKARHVAVDLGKRIRRKRGVFSGVIGVPSRAGVLRSSGLKPRVMTEFQCYRPNGGSWQNCWEWA
jgi:hypothetical protein